MLRSHTAAPQPSPFSPHTPLTLTLTRNKYIGWGRATPGSEVHITPAFCDHLPGIVCVLALVASKLSPTPNETRFFFFSICNGCFTVVCNTR